MSTYKGNFRDFWLLADWTRDTLEHGQQDYIPAPGYRAAADRLVARGLAHRIHGRAYAPTVRGLTLMDEIAAAFLKG